MNYFKIASDHFRENKSKSIVMMVLDLIHLILYVPIFMLFLFLVVKQVQSVPLQFMGGMMQSLEGIQNLQDILMGILLNLIGVIFLFILLIILNVSFFKCMVWGTLLKKKVSVKIVMKGILVTSSVLIIFIVPLLLSLYPFFILANQSMNSMLIAGYPTIRFNVLHLIPLAILVFLFTYILSLSYYHLTKTSSYMEFLKSFKFQKFFPIGLVYFIQFFSLIFLMYIINLGNIGNVWVALILLLVFIVTSHFNRVFLIKNLAIHI